MKALEAKIPPLLLMLAFAGAMYGVATLGLAHFDSGNYGLTAAALLFRIGLVFCTLAIIAFRRVDTTVNPTSPSSSSALVTSGIFRISRNPMYVAFLLFLLAWGLYLADALAIALALLFQRYLTAFQIKPEERALRRLFGDEYDAYLSRVRRWL